MAKRQASAPARQAAPALTREPSNTGIRPGRGESRVQESVVTEWDDLNMIKETPPDGSLPPVDDKPDLDEEAKQEKIREMLGRKDDAEHVIEEPAPGAKVEPAAKVEAKVDDKPVVETPKPTRADTLTKLQAQKDKLGLERQLTDERAKRKAAEDRADAAGKADLKTIAKARGLTDDQALSEILSKDGTPAAAVPAKGDTVDTRLSKLEQREAAMAKREAIGVVDTLTKDLDIPIVRASARVAVTDAQGNTQIMSGRELVLETAKRLWEADGEPRDGAGRPTGQTEYIRRAAEATEEQLVADDKERFEAYATKTGRKPPVETPKPKTEPVPSVGRRSGGAGPKVDPGEGLPSYDDPEARREAIKRRMGW